MEDNHLTEVLTELKRRALEKDTSVGFNPTGIPGLSVVVRTQAGEKRSFSRPYLAIVLQGKKRMCEAVTDVSAGTTSYFRSHFMFQ